MAEENCMAEGAPSKHHASVLFPGGQLAACSDVLTMLQLLRSNMCW